MAKGITTVKITIKSIFTSILHNSGLNLLCSTPSIIGMESPLSTLERGYWAQSVDRKQDNIRWYKHRCRCRLEFS